jgi:chitodextrinase
MRIKQLLLILLVIMIAEFSAPSAFAYAQGTSADPLDPTSMPAPGNTVNSPCAASSPSSGAYKVTLCLTSPSAGATLTGSSSISISVHVEGKNPGILYVTYFLDGAYLIVSYQSPFAIVLPSDQWENGTHIISVAVSMTDGYTTANQPSVTVTFDNTNPQLQLNNPTTDNVNSLSQASVNTFLPSFTTPPPGSPFIVVAAGDGADGSTNENKVTNEIVSINPNLFLYLGDVYFSGTDTEFYNNYGSGSNFYSQFRSITDPTVGNHEYLTTNAAGYFNYWNNIPPYYSFNAGGWHFVSINSNLSKVGGSSTSGPEYTWLAADLAANSSLCTIAYYHHPLYNIGPEGPDTNMANIWKLLAQNGVSLVLNGHDHDYQRWKALDGSGNPSSNGITEIIVGTGGHGIQTISGSDTRVVFSADTSPQAYGVVKLSLASNGASFSYINYAGVTLDSGFAPCSKGVADTQSPSVPSGVAASATSATQVNLSWQASNDNVGVAGYTIYRGGTKLATVSGTSLSYSDTTVSPSTTYSYAVDAFDAAGNHSAQSSPVSVTTPVLQDTQAPSVPAGLTASAASPTQVNLAWQASSDNVGVTGYTVYRGGVKLGTVSGATLSYSDITVSSSTTYSYTVDAFDAAGNHSAQSSPASVTTPAVLDTQPPSAPAGLAATAASATQVNLSWQASSDNVGVTGYTIYRAGATLATVSGTKLSYSDTTVSPTTTYSYSVDAFDAAGNHSAQSSPVSITTPAMSTSITFTVGADTYVNSGSPSTNFGGSTKWYTDGSPIVNGLLKFTVSGLNGLTPQHAYLHVYANSGSSAGINIYSISDNSWAENTVTWNTVPAFGTLLGASGAITAGSWLTIDVSSFVTGEGTFSFGASTPGSTNISFAAKESGINAAYLVVALP